MSGEKPPVVQRVTHLEEGRVLGVHRARAVKSADQPAAACPLEAQRKAVGCCVGNDQGGSQCHQRLTDQRHLHASCIDVPACLAAGQKPVAGCPQNARAHVNLERRPPRSATAGGM